MPGRFDRRRFLQATAAAAGAAAFPMPAVAQNAPLKVGLMTVKTGPLAAGGFHLEEGFVTYLKARNFTLAGRKIDLIVADTGGNPAGAKTKAIELVERDHVDLVMGPLAAFELLAILDYLAEHKVPTLAFAGAEDVTQRRRNPYLVRTSYSSAQGLYPLADYAVKEMKAKRAITMADDFAFGYEQVGGFQRVFENGGGRIVKKLWSPLNTPDYTPYIVQIQDCDLVCEALVGSNPLKFTKLYHELGTKQVLIGGTTVADDTIMGAFSDEAIGLINSIPYTLDLDTEPNHRFLAEMRKNYGQDVAIGTYSACFYVNGQIIEAALEKTGGKSDDPELLMKAVRSVSLTDTPRGPLRFDDYGNPVFDVYIRRIEKQNGKLVNRTIKTYHEVSQFWTDDPKWFLQQPVFSRDYPPLKS
ncbi:MAG TPA: ABC transporter substrate-binding protein [Xanthobacteraceae bacterium]|nr:ABC transporter substrate-binding protein [Xanthobacteraceae bacterium]